MLQPVKTLRMQEFLNIRISIQKQSDVVLFCLLITYFVFKFGFCPLFTRATRYVNVVFAVATCLSHAGIVSKWLNLFKNFFDHLVAPSF